MIFLGSKIKKPTFSTFSKQNPANLIDNFHEDSFEVYYKFVSQKLVILEFLSKYFFHFDLGHF
jgi:hypothetical protein